MMSLEKMNVDNMSPIHGVAETNDMGFNECVNHAAVRSFIAHNTSNPIYFNYGVHCCTTTEQTWLSLSVPPLSFIPFSFFFFNPAPAPAP